MPHRLHVCEGLILAQRDFGEANRLYYVLTSEFGRVIALAQGVRHLKSKLRYHLHAGDFVALTLVRGREFWRITGAQAGEQFLGVDHNVDKQVVANKWCHLILRLVRGEERAPELFSRVRDGYHLLQTLESQMLADGELMIVWQILAVLGYIDASEPIKSLAQVQVNRQPILAMVNQALTASQL